MGLTKLVISILSTNPEKFWELSVSEAIRKPKEHRKAEGRGRALLQ